jgi:uncharacterized protein YbjT (DUF2867 family)
MHSLVKNVFLLLAALMATAGGAQAAESPGTSAAQEKQQMILVAGATGRLGRVLVEELLREGYSVRAMVRDEARGREALGPDVELVEADVKDPASLRAAATGVDALISTIGANRPDGPDRPETIDYQGVQNLVDVAIAAEVGHFVLVSSRGVTNVHHGLNSGFGNVLIWKLLGEHYLRASGLSYTVVRPGGLTDDTPRQHAIYFEQGDPLASNSVSRGDVAMILVAVLRNAEARGRTFEINRTAGTPPADWTTLFADLVQD